MGQPAYDLKEFENRPVARPRVRVERGRSRTYLLIQRRLKNLRLVLGGALFVALVCTLLSCQVTITELTADIQTSQNDLVAAQSQYDYLQTSLDNATSMTNVALSAVSDLGLVKLDPSQITYIALSEKSKITRTENTWQKMLASIKSTALCLVEELNQ